MKQIHSVPLAPGTTCVYLSAGSKVLRVVMGTAHGIRCPHLIVIADADALGQREHRFITIPEDMNQDPMEDSDFRYVDTVEHVCDCDAEKHKHNLLIHVVEDLRVDSSIQNIGPLKSGHAKAQC